MSPPVHYPLQSCCHSVHLLIAKLKRRHHHAPDPRAKRSGSAAAGNEAGVVMSLSFLGLICSPAIHWRGAMRLHER